VSSSILAHYISTSVYWKTASRKGSNLAKKSSLKVEAGVPCEPLASSKVVFLVLEHNAAETKAADKSARVVGR
jgi:hypothetical protein